MQDQVSQFLNPELILKQIDILPGSKVGDLGCGSGYMSFAASRAVGERGKVFAVDVQKQILEQVKKEAQSEGLDNIEVIWSDLETIGATKIANQLLDVVILTNTLFLVQDKTSVVGEAKRLLKTGGKLLIVEWRPGNMNIGPPSDKRISLDEIKQITSQQGFSQEKEVDAGKYHFGTLFKNG